MGTPWGASAQHTGLSPAPQAVAQRGLRGGPHRHPGPSSRWGGAGRGGARPGALGSRSRGALEWFRPVGHTGDPGQGRGPSSFVRKDGHEEHLGVRQEVASERLTSRLGGGDAMSQCGQGESFPSPPPPQGSSCSFTRLPETPSVHPSGGTHVPRCHMPPSDTGHTCHGATCPLVPHAT